MRDLILAAALAVLLWNTWPPAYWPDEPRGCTTDAECEAAWGLPEQAAEPLEPPARG